jgi:hypothetical protein
VGVLTNVVTMQGLRHDGKSLGEVMILLSTLGNSLWVTDPPTGFKSTLSQKKAGRCWVRWLHWQLAACEI